jgi:hypothetical protein
MKKVNTIESKNTDFLFDVNDPQLNVLLEESIKNNYVSVVATTGKVDNFGLKSKMSRLRHEIYDEIKAKKDKENKYEVLEYYDDDGEYFTASVSVVKKPKKNS